MRWFALKIKAPVSLLLTTVPEIKILVTLTDLHFKLTFLKLSMVFFEQGLGFHH